jgi:L-glutamine-phosphate cytidylyltransferase
MKAIILAAGPGSRMLPHTQHRPKCLMKIGGHPILHYQLAALRHCGIHDINIVVGYLADRIREHVTVPVTFIDNREYATTGSSYSLWRAREVMQDGFVYLNSDLVFHPDMLRALLEAPAQNAVIVDRQVHLTSDMQKAEMNGDRIVRMGKHLAAETAAAEVVGPVKFGAAGARRIIGFLERLVAAGDRNRWAYEVFGLVAEELEFTGVDNPGCFWAEVDTPSEALEANQRIPRTLVDFADGRITAPPPIERRQAPSIDLRPVQYMDHLLNSHFAPIVEAVPEGAMRIRGVLRRNKDEFIEHVRQLGVHGFSAIDLHGALQSEVHAIESALGRVYDADAVLSAAGLESVIRDVSRRCPPEFSTGLCLKAEVAAELLRRHPPVAMMEALGYSTAHQLMRGEGPLTALALTRTTENREWQVKYKQLLSARTAEDFEQRPLGFLAADSQRYRRAFMSSKQPPKLWRMTHNKESGQVVCLTPDDPTRFQTPLLQYVLVFMHYFFETAYAARYYQQVAARDPEGLGQAVVNTIDSHREKLTFFYSNVYSENLFWQQAVELFARTFPGAGIEWFTSTTARGEYCVSTGVQNIAVSLNLVDHLWNINFLGHAGMDSFQHDAIYFLYHFRGALWQEIFNELTGLGPTMEDLIVEYMGLGDTILTERLLAERRAGADFSLASGTR